MHRRGALHGGLRVVGGGGAARGRGGGARGRVRAPAGRAHHAPPPARPPGRAPPLPAAGAGRLRAPSHDATAVRITHITPNTPLFFGVKQ